MSDKQQCMRLLIDGHLDGPTNMGRDEALLHGAGRGSSPATLRWYRWSPPTISLGYFQAYADFEALPPPANRLAVVRRVTGGGAILHDAELTYSLVLPRRHVQAGGDASCLYQAMHDAIIAACRALGITAARRGSCTSTSRSQTGPFFCFARAHPTDVVIGEAKLAGSAQRRLRDAVLQHGSIVLERRFDQHPGAALGPTIFARQFIELTTRFLAEAWGRPFAPGTWSEAEKREAAIHAERFRDPLFIHRR